MSLCEICKRDYKVITNTHLKTHQMSVGGYIERFGLEGVGFAKIGFQILRNDPRYKLWRASLLRRPPPWNKGQTKLTSISVSKISETFKKRNIDNFANWRIEAREKGIIPKSYPKLKRSEKLAFLIGLTLGDGNIHAFPRTERLTVALNIKYRSLVVCTKTLLEELFNKRASLHQQGNGIRVWIYQKHISRRLGIPSGDRRNSKVGMPGWVWRFKPYLVACLKGLFEAEGSLSIHLPTCTYNFQFSNTNPVLLKDVGSGLETLGFHPEYRNKATRLRKRDEVKKFENLISFRQKYY